MCSTISQTCQSTRISNHHPHPHTPSWTKGFGCDIFREEHTVGGWVWTCSAHGLNLHSCRFLRIYSRDGGGLEGRNRENGGNEMQTKGWRGEKKHTTLTTTWRYHCAGSELRRRQDQRGHGFVQTATRYKQKVLQKYDNKIILNNPND